MTRFFFPASQNAWSVRLIEPVAPQYFVALRFCLLRRTLGRYGSSSLLRHNILWRYDFACFAERLIGMALRSCCATIFCGAPSLPASQNALVYWVYAKAQSNTSVPQSGK